MEFSPLITFIAQVVIMVGAILWSKYIVPKLSPRTIEKAREGLELLTSYANKYVAWADNFMPDAKGAAKMASVVDQLRIIANNNKIKTNDQELQAIAQKSFDDMELEWNGVEDEEEITDTSLPCVPTKATPENTEMQDFVNYLNNVRVIKEAINHVLPDIAKVVNEGSTEETNPAIVSAAIQSTADNITRYIFIEEPTKFQLKNAVNNIAMDIARAVANESDGKVTSISESFTELSKNINSLVD